MSEVDNLMVQVMMRGDDEAENAAIRLIQMAEKGELNSNQNRQLLKAIERRMEKVSSGTDLHDFLLRLAKIINPKAQPQGVSNPPPPEYYHPEANNPDE